MSVIKGCPQGESLLYSRKLVCWAPRGGGGGGGLLWISSDGDDRRIILGLKFSIPGCFWVGKFGKYFFFCGLI